MKKMMILGIATSMLAISSCSTSTVPLTGRKYSTFGVSAAQLEQQAAIGYSQLLSSPSTKVVSNSSANTQMIKRVGAKISAAVNQYMNQNGYGEQIKGYKWEFNLIESPEINAWCMPGGKVAVYTGILPITKDEAGLATVMGHEIAHAIAQHSLERASKSNLAQLGSVAVAVGAGASGASENSQATINQLFGLGAQAGYILPNSRQQELEADKMGLSFMAMAGYNPTSAISFWQRMAQASSGSAKPPVFLSTHPTDQSRIAQIQKDLPAAMKYYKGR
ncbi:M48 family metallopeptidase [Pedobacter polaris]|uniref:M48 family metallopeptidase n=1 Tax=Pedobacter polaris TaxID=2571273 RepID=A0A4U1CE08_9SPHI|nr:M48 family metallopeptidase [Pedobacter polaris]TKC04614.1 M48 family metallopeptidase [Pedobacter polaris]